MSYGPFGKQRRWICIAAGREKARVRVRNNIAAGGEQARVRVGIHIMVRINVRAMLRAVRDSLGLLSRSSSACEM